MQSMDIEIPICFYLCVNNTFIWILEFLLQNNL